MSRRTSSPFIHAPTAAEISVCDVIRKLHSHTTATRQPISRKVEIVRAFARAQHSFLICLPRSQCWTTGSWPTSTEDAYARNNRGRKLPPDTSERQDPVFQEASDREYDSESRLREGSAEGSALALCPCHESPPSSASGFPYAATSPVTRAKA